MAFKNESSEEDLQNLLKKIMQASEVTPGGYKLPPGLLERLGVTSANTEGGRKATNVDGGGVQQDFEFGKGQSRKFQTKRLSFHKEKARALASKGEYYEACNVLEDITDSRDLGSKLLMTECYLQLGRENKANKCLRQVEETLKSDPVLPPSDLVDMAKDYLKDSSYVRAMIIIKIAADIYLNSSETPDEILSGVYRCCNKLDDIVREMLKQGGRNRTVAADMGLEILIELFEKFGDIKNCNRDSQVIKEAQICRFVGHKYSMLDDVRKAMKYVRIAVTKMDEHFTPLGAQRYHIYAGQLHNLAIALGNLQRFDEAAAVYHKAIDAYENAVDFPSDGVKKALTDKAKGDLRQLRSVMG